MLLHADDQDTPAVRNHLHGGRRVPAGVGTFTAAGAKRLLPSGCPGVFGPVPQPVLMDGRSLPGLFPIVNRFMRMKRLNFDPVIQARVWAIL